MSVISSLFSKIAAIFMSLITFITGLFGGVLVPSVDGYVALENTSISILKSRYLIIDSYDEFIEAVGEIKDETEKYDEEYFEEKSLLAFNVTLPQTNYYVVCDSIDEAGETVTVRYHLKNDGSFGLTMISSQSVIVEIEKDISELVLFEGTSLIYDSTADPEPVECKTYVEDKVASVASNKDVQIVHTYEDWQKVITYDYDEQFDEAYFEQGSVVVISVEGPDLNYKPVVKKATELNGVLDIAYNVEGMIPRILFGVSTVSLIIVETSKNIETVNIDETVIERPFYNHTDLLRPVAIVTDEKDGNVTFIRSYDEYIKAVPDKSFRSAYYDRDFFDEYSLVLVTVAVPDSGYYIDFSYDDIFENGNTLELGYQIKEDSYQGHKDMIIYRGFLIQINKNITDVNINEISDKKHFYYYGAETFTLPDNFENTVVHDYESWSKLYSGTDCILSEYDEEYFENGSIAAVAVTLPDANRKVRLRTLKENSSTLELKSRISESDTPNSVNQIIIIETSKNVTEITNEIKELKNKVYSYPHFTTPINISSDKPISTYEEFLEAAGNGAIKDQYNEEFFEENSLLVMVVTMPDTATIFKADYAYENGNVLELGYIRSDCSGAGLAVISYQYVIIEVSKNIETVNESFIRDY